MFSYLTIATNRIAKCFAMYFVWLLFIAAITPTLLAASSAETTADPVTIRGLRHTTNGQDTATKAMWSANTLLTSVESRYRLYANWSTKPSMPKDFSLIPVFLVSTYPEAHTTPAAVPVGCICVFVNPESLFTWSDKQKGGPDRLKLDVHRLLAFMLLHEVGHIAKNSTGMEFVNGELSELNVDASLAKISEQDADEFASRIVSDVKDKKPASDISIEANWISIVLATLSLDLQVRRSIDEFGSTSTGEPTVFFDPDLSHPNLEWRILRSNYLIQKTPITKALLDSFEEVRRHDERQKPLYKSNPDD